MSRSALAEFAAVVDPKQRAVVERLAAILEGSTEPLDMAVKWRRLTFARGNDFHNWICGISATKSTVDLVFHFGGLLPDPDSRFIAGTSRFLRKLEFRSPADLDEDLILGFTNMALSRLQYFKENWKAIQAGKMSGTT